MFSVENLTRTRVFLLCRHPAKFESLWHVICLGTMSCLSKLWMHRGSFDKKRMHLFSASTSAVVSSAIALANSSLANCNSIRSGDKHASRMTLERYDVESCGESLIVRELSLARSPGVFTSLLFDCKPEILINNSGLRFQYALALFQTVVQPIVSHGSEIVLDMSQGVVVLVPMLQCASQVNVCSILP